MLSILFIVSITCCVCCSVEDRRVFASLKGHNGTIRSVSFNQAAHAPNLLASGGAGDCRPRVWDISTGQCVSTLSPHDAAIHSVLWDTESHDTHNTNLVVSGDESGTLMIHDIRLSYNTNILQVEASSLGSHSLGGSSNSSGICHMSLSQGSGSGTGTGYGSMLGIGCVGGYVSLFNMNTRSVVATTKLHGDDCRAVCMFNQFNHNNPNHNPNPSHATMLTTSFDSKASVWDVDTTIGGRGFSNICQLSNSNTGEMPQSQSHSHTDKILGCCMNDNQDILTTGADGKVLCWKPRV